LNAAVHAHPEQLLFFFDEGRFGLQSTLIRIWAKRGIPLSQRVQQGYQNFYLYSCVSPFSGESFTLFLPEVNTDMMNIFFEELAKEYPDREIRIVMDQAGWHKAKDLMYSNNIAPVYLPSYSPELNPIERLWQWLRKEVTHNELFETLEDMMDALEQEFLKLTPERLAQLCHCSYL
jgi:transposase